MGKTNENTVPDLSECSGAVRESFLKETPRLSEMMRRQHHIDLQLNALVGSDGVHQDNISVSDLYESRARMLARSADYAMSSENVINNVGDILHKKSIVARAILSGLASASMNECLQMEFDLYNEQLRQLLGISNSLK